MRTTRLDRSVLAGARYDERGYMYDSPVLTRTGVFNYRNADGSTRREYRPPDEVFNKDSLDSYRGKPFTVQHQKVDAKNARAITVGTVLSEGREDGKDGFHRLLRADVVVHDPSAIKENGWKDISVGYSISLDETPGISPEGEKYDAIQRNIRVDHVAIVPQGRAGVSKFNVDRFDAVSEDISIPAKTDGEPKKMATLRMDSGLEYEAAPEVVVAYNKLREDAAATNDALQKEQARADSAEAKLAAAEKEKEQIRKDANEKAQRRMKLEAAAKAQGVEPSDEKSDRELQEGVIKSVRGDAFDLDGKSDSYIDAAYDMALADVDAKARADAAAGQRKVAVSTVTAPSTSAAATRGDSISLDEARDNMRRTRMDSWKNGSKNADND